jgi:hypothetical protein
MCPTPRSCPTTASAGRSRRGSTTRLHTQCALAFPACYARAARIRSQPRYCSGSCPSRSTCLTSAPRALLLTRSTRFVVSLCACTPHGAAAAQFCIARAGLAQPHARGRGGEQVGALDILLFNTDRHEGNLLLARRGGRARGRGLGGPVGKLVPIDHALCLPEVSPHAGRNRLSLRSHARCIAIPNRTRNKFLGTGRKRCHVDPSCAGGSQSSANADCFSRARRKP